MGIITLVDVQTDEIIILEDLPCAQEHGFEIHGAKLLEDSRESSDFV